MRARIQKDPTYIKYSSKHLNDVLVNIKSSVNSNRPKHVRHKRRTGICLRGSDSKSSSDITTSSISSDDEINIMPAGQKNLTKKRKTTFKLKNSKSTCSNNV